MQNILIQLRNNSYLFILFTIVIVILLAFYKKIGISIKEITIKIKKIIAVSFKLNNHNKKNKTEVILSKTKIKKSKISDISGNVNIENVHIEDSEIGNIKGS